MKCIYCGGETGVINSRLKSKSNNVWRRRKCDDCQAVFTTEESVKYDGSLLYDKGQGSLEPFSRHKLLISVYEACRHRKEAPEAAEALTSTIIGKCIPLAEQGVISSETVTSTAYGVLKRFDRAAATAYSAFHPL